MKNNYNGNGPNITGSGTLSIASGVNVQLTGTVTVNNLRVENGATLTFNPPLGSNNTLTTLTVGNGATVNFGDDVWLYVAHVTNKDGNVTLAHNPFVPGLTTLSVTNLILEPGANLNNVHLTEDSVLIGAFSVEHDG